MKLAYTILYVPDVARALAFYETAFGLETRFLHESGHYAEMETGATALAFASYDMARANLPNGFRESDPTAAPGNVEIVFTTSDVQAAFEVAVEAGAASLVQPQTKPWGQTVGYLRDPEGNLIELASPMAPAAAQPAPRRLLTILAVEDVERSACFYRGVFGWPARVEVSAYVEFELPGGCGLGVYQREAFSENTGQRPAVTPAGAISATEIYLQHENLEECIARLEAHGAKKLSERADRLWGDEAAYYADPDGNVVVVAAPLSGAGGTENETS